MPLSTCAQENDRWLGVGIETNSLAGRIIKHSSRFTAPIPPLSTAFDVNFLWQTYGKRDWHQRLRFPIVGFGITYTDYGNDDVFGRCVGLYTDIQIPLIKREKYEWTLRIGDGIGYVTKRFQATAPVDTVNTAISTHINDFGIFMTDFRYHINKHWDAQAGANFTHLSNALFKEPNLGINMGGAHIAVRYFPVTSKPNLIIRDSVKLKNRLLFQVRAGVGFNQSRTPGNPELPDYVGSLYASRRWKGKNKLFAGTDYSFHESNYQALKYWQLFRDNEREHSWYGAFFAGNEFLVGRLGIMTQLGIYYHQIYLKQDLVYEKLGGNFYLVRSESGFLKELFVSVLLKTHRFTAEFAEFGIGAGF